MANFPTIRLDKTGGTFYATLNNAAGEYWDTTGTPAYETLVPASWGDYDIALTETPASSYQYVVAVPATLTADALVYATVYEQAGGSPAITDPVVYTGMFWWDGTIVTDGGVTGDGVSEDEFRTAVMAVLFGNNAPVSGANDFKKRDGSTTAVTVTNNATGTRTLSTIV
jgi:hypothetical protein